MGDNVVHVLGHISYIIIFVMICFLCCSSWGLGHHYGILGICVCTISLST